MQPFVNPCQALKISCQALKTNPLSSPQDPLSSPQDPFQVFKTLCQVLQARRLVRLCL
jgi:hypothetical protein